MNLFLKYNHCKQEGKYTVINFRIPRQVYVPKWERMINLFMLNSPEGWDTILESEIESFLPMFDYLGIRQVVPRLVRHILVYTERDTEREAQKGVVRVASICRKIFP